MSGAEPTRDAPASISVLVVDDDTMFLELMAELLGEAGYEVTTASDANTTADLVASDAIIDILLCDIDLRSNGSGVAIARNARDARPDIPVLFISGHSTHLATSIMADLDNVFFLQKPFRWEQLSKTLREVLASVQ